MNYEPPQKPLKVYLILIAAVSVTMVAMMTYDITERKPKPLPRKHTYQMPPQFSVSPDQASYMPAHTPWPTMLTESRAITVSHRGLIYIAGDSLVNIFEPAGHLLKTLELPGEPTAIQWFDNKLFIALNNQFIIHNLQTGQQEKWDLKSEAPLITSLAVDNENIYLADASNRIVLRCDHQGNIINRIGEADPENKIPGFVVPSPYFDLALAPDGLLRVVNPGRHQIEAYTPNGDREFAWGKPGAQVENFCGCCNPVSLALLPDGRFVTAEKGMPRVKIYDLDGNFQTFVAGADLLLDADETELIMELPGDSKIHSYDLAVSNETIILLDRGRNLVHSFIPRHPLKHEDL